MHATGTPSLQPSDATTQGGPRSLFVCAVASLLFPGLGHLYARRPFKALLMAVAIGGLFVGGLAMTGFTAVNPTTHRLEFVAHIFAAGPTAITLHLTQGLEPMTYLPWYEVGRLYVACAGILNVVAIWDAMHTVFDHNQTAIAQQRYDMQREATRELEAWRAEERERNAENDVEIDVQVETAPLVQVAGTDAPLMEDAGPDRDADTDHAGESTPHDPEVR